MIKTCGVGVQSFHLFSLHHRHCKNENTVLTKRPTFQDVFFSGTSKAQARGGTSKFLFLELASPCKGRSRWAVSTTCERCCSSAPQQPLRLQNSLRGCCGTALEQELCASGCSEGVSSGEPSDKDQITWWRAIRCCSPGGTYGHTTSQEHSDGVNKLQAFEKVFWEVFIAMAN